MISYYARPGTAREAVRLQLEHSGSQYLAGGTDILVDRYKDGECDRKLIDISALESLRGIDPETRRIGALTTFSSILRDREAGAEIALLRETASQMAAAQIRNRATIGGNICNGSPSADSLPALLVLEATAVFLDKEGEKAWPLARFLREKKNRGPETLLEYIELGRLPEGAGAAFVKVGRRSSLSIARLNACALIVPDGSRIREARVSIGAVAPVTQRFPETEACLTGRSCCEELWKEAGETARREMEPFVHARLSAAYKLPVACDLIAELLEVCYGRCDGGGI